jgi:ribonuclease Z
VLLTHFHSDHIGELGNVGMQTWALGRAAPLPVYGPPGVQAVVSGFETAFALDTGYRVAHHGADLVPPEARTLVARTVPVPKEGEAALVLQDGDVRVTAFLVNHAPVAPAYGYRIDYAGRSVVVSGDTSKDENLIRHARGADLLVHDALAAQLIGAGRDAAAAAGIERRARILGDIIGYHATPVEAAEVAAASGARLLVLSHLVPGPRNAIMRHLFLRGVEAAWDGEVLLGEEGMHFRLPGNSEAIEREQLD